MSRRLDDLDQRIRPLAYEFVARCSEQGIMVLITDTLRTHAEQEANIKKGVSWTTNSKHLPQPPDGLSLAFDVAPYMMFHLNGPDKFQWDTSDPVWIKMGQIGERLGLRWGGRWTKKDMCHFEYITG